jgi:hypothetical protein
MAGVHAEPRRWWHRADRPARPNSLLGRVLAEPDHTPYTRRTKILKSWHTDDGFRIDVNAELEILVTGDFAKPVVRDVDALADALYEAADLVANRVAPAVDLGATAAELPVNVWVTRADLDSAVDHGTTISVTGTTEDGRERVTFAGHHRTMAGLMTLVELSGDCLTQVEPWQILARGLVPPADDLAACSEVHHDLFTGGAA